MSRKLFLIAVLLLFLSMPAFAQTPRAELSAGYAFMRDQSIDMNFQGWVGSVTANYNRWFGLEGELGGSYKTTQALGVDINLDVHSFLAGARFAARTHEGSELVPFAHVLAGAARRNVSVLGISQSNTDPMLQPGAGVDYWLRPRVGVRLGGDYRRFFGDGSGINEFRFQAGIIFGFGAL